MYQFSSNKSYDSAGNLFIDESIQIFLCVNKTQIEMF